MPRPSNSLIRSAWVKELFAFYNNPTYYGNIQDAWNYIKSETMTYASTLNQLVDDNKEYLDNSRRRQGPFLNNYINDLKDIILKLKQRPDIDEEEIKRQFLEDLIQDEDIKNLLIEKGKYNPPPPPPASETCNICFEEVNLQAGLWKSCNGCNYNLCSNCCGQLQRPACVICRKYNAYQDRPLP